MKVEIGPNEAGQRLDKFVRKWLKDVPLSAIYKNIRKGKIRVNDKKVKEKYYLNKGDIVETIEIFSKPEKEKFQRVDKNLKITYEDKNMILVEKKAGVLVHSDSKQAEATLTDQVLTYLCDTGDYIPEKEITFTPASCNRLDRNTSGIVIFAKNFQSLKLINEMIRERNIKRYYFALVKGKIKDGVYEAYILKNEDNNISKVYKEANENTKKIAMEVKNIDSNNSFSFIRINLITGRSHQLRAHLNFLNNPIIGDNKYGDKKINSYFNNKYGLNYQYLYASKVVFKNCPEELSYLENKTIAESLPPILKKIKNDIFNI